jgi:hypothetical protein
MASFFTLERGTPVIDRFGQPVGRVDEVLIAYGEHFDGVVVATPNGPRFVDAPEVRRIAHDRVRLATPLHDVGEGIGEGVDRVTANEHDREAAIAGLAAAYREGRLELDELEHRIHRAHHATELDELDALVADVL